MFSYICYTDSIYIYMIIHVCLSCLHFLGGTSTLESVTWWPHHQFWIILSHYLFKLASAPSLFFCNSSNIEFSTFLKLFSVFSTLFSYSVLKFWVNASISSWTNSSTLHYLLLHTSVELLIFFFSLVFIFWPHRAVHGILVPWAGIQPGLSAIKSAKES